MSAAPDATVGPFGHAAPLYRAAGYRGWHCVRYGKRGA